MLKSIANISQYIGESNYAGAAGGR